MNEFIPAFIQEDDTAMDAYEAREAYEQANKSRALIIARDLRKRAQKLLEHARKLEAVAHARTDGCPGDDKERLERYIAAEGMPCEIPVFVDGGYRFLDPATLADCGVRDLGDEDVLREYIGSSADVTKEYLEDAGRFLEVCKALDAYYR